MKYDYLWSVTCKLQPSKTTFSRERYIRWLANALPEMAHAIVLNAYTETNNQIRKAPSTRYTIAITNYVAAFMCIRRRLSVDIAAVVANVKRIARVILVMKSLPTPHVRSLCKNVQLNYII